MPVIVQNTQTVIKPDVYDILGPDYKHDRAKIYNRLRKGPDVPNAVLFSYPHNLPIEPDNAGSPEAVAWAAADASKKKNTELLYARMHHKVTRFGIGEVAAGNHTFGNNGGNDFDTEMDLHLEYQINSAERIIIGEQEANAGNGVDNFVSRGLERAILDTARIALQTDGQTVIPENFRPSADQVQTLTIASNDYTLSEDALMAPLEAIYNRLLAELDLDLFCTTRFKKKISKMGTFVPNVTDTTVIRRFNHEAAGKKMNLVIDTYTGDCGTVRAEKHPYLRRQNTQKAEALGVDMSYLQLRVRKAPIAVELKDEGSGRRGRTEQTFGLQVIPTYMAQFRRDD